MDNSFNVLPCLVPTNFTFWSGQRKMFSSSKITGISSWSTDLHPHLEVSRKLKEAFYYFFSSFVPVFFKKWIWPEDSTSRWTYRVSHLMFMSSRWCRKRIVDLKTVICLCRMPLGFSLLEAHAFTIKCPCPSCFQGKTQEKQSKKKKKRSGAFYSACRLVH